jgi:hypothetical protein
MTRDVHASPSSIVHESLRRSMAIDAPFGKPHIGCLVAGVPPLWRRCAAAAERIGIAEVERMKTEYRGYQIITEVTRATSRGWSLALGIVDPTGAPLVTGLNLGGELVFATEALAERAGVLLAQYWIDAGLVRRGD